MRIENVINISILQAAIMQTKVYNRTFWLTEEGSRESRHLSFGILKGKFEECCWIKCCVVVSVWCQKSDVSEMSMSNSLSHWIPVKSMSQSKSNSLSNRKRTHSLSDHSDLMYVKPLSSMCRDPRQNPHLIYLHFWRMFSFHGPKTKTLNRIACKKFMHLTTLWVFRSSPLPFRTVIPDRFTLICPFLFPGFIHLKQSNYPYHTSQSINLSRKFKSPTKEQHHKLDFC